MKTRYIIMTSSISIIILFLLEQVFHSNYLGITIIKIFLFFLIPLLVIKYIKKEALRDALRLDEKNNLRYGMLLGIVGFFLIFLIYFLVKNSIDVSKINDTMEQYRVTKTNFILIALYVIFVNSLLEEFYFRGFIFLNMYENSHKKIAYVYSGMLFSLYHIANFITWFTVPLILLTVFLLFIVGLFFNFVNTFSKNFLNSWIIHILADISLMIIGYMIIF